MPLTTPPFPSTSIPIFTRLHNISLLNIEIAALTDDRGLGIQTTKNITSINTPEPPVILKVPKEVLLTRDNLNEWSGVDPAYRVLKEAVKATTFRIDSLLFLLLQVTIASEYHQSDETQAEKYNAAGVSGPWTEYVRILPTSVPVPTMWSELERKLLTGTSLESALDAKLASLEREFNILREATSSIPWCRKFWWDDSMLGLQQWILLDAWFRSRSLELPSAGAAMVPCLDMANHANVPNAYYEETLSGDVVLLLRPGIELAEGDEVTLSYDGDGRKCKAEMVFAYGFVGADGEMMGMTLHLETIEGDPLGKAKSASFDGPQVVNITVDKDKLGWESAFLYFTVLNEEDGLEFRVLQQVDGTRSSLRVFWQGNDVTDQTQNFEALIYNHELEDVFRLRVVALLKESFRQQLMRLSDSEGFAQELSLKVSADHSAPFKLAIALRRSEELILKEALAVVEEQEAKLLEKTNVRHYLFMSNNDGEEEPGNKGMNEEDDFS